MAANAATMAELVDAARRLPDMAMMFSNGEEGRFGRIVSGKPTTWSDGNRRPARGRSRRRFR
ncbi:hypothetical protein MPLA_450002 [Mesorhizobium sp. ORS 3359]|nr:hypothetical protein MPLA_450002 [Mesorhizobium sp. ORS 3359]